LIDLIDINVKSFEKNMLNVSFREKKLYKNEAITVLINDQLKIYNDILEIDKQLQHLILKAIRNASRFQGRFGQTLFLSIIEKNEKLQNIIVVGIGNEKKLKSYQLEELGGIIYSRAKEAQANSVKIRVDYRIGLFLETEIAVLLASGGLLAAYKFDKYLTKQKEEDKFVISTFNVIVKDEYAAYKAFEEKKAIAMGVYFARDLVSEVPNVLYPENYAHKIIEELKPLGVDIKVLGEHEMLNLGMGAIIGVGQGSMNESKLVVMEYNSSFTDQKPVCFVGKGVTFDTGGISIKPAHNMGDMKYDMAGSAAVVGLIKALALRSAKVNVVGIIGLVENMPGGKAQRPGDIVTSMSGQTIEILDTDAEGRLVLCDCITYLQKNFEPDCIIDLATLTGAISVALGYTYAGCFSNDDELAGQLIKSANNVNEPLWRMPLHNDFDVMLKSPIADIANIAVEQVAGSSTAAHFIKRFINDGIKWSHLDIAGMVWDKKGKSPICPVGAVGFGVRLLNQFMKDNYEVIRETGIKNNSFKR
jgi:leucyl aminopeptidase